VTAKQKEAFAMAHLYRQTIREQGQKPRETYSTNVDPKLVEVRMQFRQLLLDVIEQYKWTCPRAQQGWGEEILWQNILDDCTEHPKRFLLVCMHEQKRRCDKVHALAVPDGRISAISSNNLFKTPTKPDFS
jgi:hypothetical protein